MNLNEEFQFQETLKDEESFNNQRLEKYIRSTNISKILCQFDIKIHLVLMDLEPSI